MCTIILMLLLLLLLSSSASLTKHHQCAWQFAQNDKSAQNNTSLLKGLYNLDSYKGNNKGRRGWNNVQTTSTKDWKYICLHPYTELYYYAQEGHHHSDSCTKISLLLSPWQARCVPLLSKAIWMAPSVFFSAHSSIFWTGFHGPSPTLEIIRWEDTPMIRAVKDEALDKWYRSLSQKVSGTCVNRRLKSRVRVEHKKAGRYWFSSVGTDWLADPWVKITNSHFKDSAVFVHEGEGVEQGSGDHLSDGGEES